MPGGNAAWRSRPSACKITPKDGHWLVPSQSGTGSYRVVPDPYRPTVAHRDCPDFEKRGEPCKHIFAVQYVVQREMRPDGSVATTETLTISERTVAERPTYRQNWPAYNAAQTTEKARFQVLLHDLCRGIPEPPFDPKRRGRPRNLRSDMVFACTFKVYSGFSARRFQSDLDDAHAKGYLTKSPHFNGVLQYLEDPALTPILYRLIVESSLPLTAIETDFAVDSTGFTSCRFDRWYDHKYGRFVREHSWVKAHFMCGVKTNVITAVEIRDKDAADSPRMPGLVQATARNFTIDEVSADKAYLSNENFEAVAETGGLAYIAFKSNTTGGIGGLFEKMYHSYCLNREDYLNHYHKRSNVESTVSMIKAKFGDHVRSKTDVAMINEVLVQGALPQHLLRDPVDSASWGSRPSSGGNLRLN